MRRVAQFAFFLAQPAAAIAIGTGLALVAIGRWALHREAELRVPRP